MSSYKKTYSPCDDCQYSYSKNGQEMDTCNICEYKHLQDSWKNNIDKAIDEAEELIDFEFDWLREVRMVNGYIPISTIDVAERAMKSKAIEIVKKGGKE